MANSSTPFGFLPYGHFGGSAPNEALEAVNVDSSGTAPIFHGDLVVRSTAGNNAVVPYLLAAQLTGVLPSGVFWGCEYYSAGAQRMIWSPYFPGSVGANATVGVTRALIISDPNTYFRGASTGTFTTADIGMNATIVTSQSSLGNTVTGQSAMILSAVAANTSSQCWRIVDLLSNRAVPGSPGVENLPYNQVILAPNNWVGTAGTIGLST